MMLVGLFTTFVHRFLTFFDVHIPYYDLICIDVKKAELIAPLLLEFKST
jgi:hypothetical protein